MRQVLGTLLVAVTLSSAVPARKQPQTACKWMGVFCSDETSFMKSRRRTDWARVPAGGPLL